MPDNIFFSLKRKELQQICFVAENSGAGTSTGNVRQHAQRVLLVAASFY